MRRSRGSVALRSRLANARRCASQDRSTRRERGRREAGYPDEAYLSRGARLATGGDFSRSRHRGAGALLGRESGGRPLDLALLRPGQTLTGFGEPSTALTECSDLAATGVSFFAMELMPRITRAQSMDALSAMATIAGYRGVLLAASHLPKMFPLLMTAAGTLTPAKVFVLGAGVAGLQAIATARRLGAVVCAYDVRPAVKEQVESVGAKFVSLEVDCARLRKTRAATRKRWTKRFTAGSASCWAPCCASRMW